jgi:DNA-binding winged helix-turn-helix (wHTH) protein
MTRRLPSTERIIAWQLVSRICSKDDLVHAVFGNDPTGGPDCCMANFISVYIFRLRDWFAEFGVTIDRDGYRFYYINEHQREQARAALVADIEQYGMSTPRRKFHRAAESRGQLPPL